MIEIKGNIFDIEADAICVTTNGLTNTKGELIMGKGLALQFKERFPYLPYYFGRNVLEHGNQVFYIKHFSDPTIFSFPTKHHWRNPSDINLIKQSAIQLANHVTLLKLKKVLLTRPGTGLGGLLWEQVKPVIESILDDRFYIVSPE